MATLPTVTLRRARDGDKRIINQTDYARDISRWARKGYKIIGLKGGNATDLQVQEAAYQSDIEKMRRTHPKREKWSGDKERAFKERAIRTSFDVTMDNEGPAEEVAEDPVKWTDVHSDWRMLKPWTARQRYVEKITGERPKSMKHAEQLMGNMAERTPDASLT